jgi:translation initiation factor IF-2
VTEGTLASGQFVVAGKTFSPVRIMEDFQGKTVKEASLSTPVRIVGFNNIPEVGIDFTTVGSKKEAEQMTAGITSSSNQTPEKRTKLPVIPILIKADALGTVDAIKHELDKFESERISVKIIDSGVGDVNVSDVQNVSATQDAIIVGFNVKVERPAQDLANRVDVEIETFSIIYELSDWLNTALKNRTPKMEEKVFTGKVKILKHFSVQKNIHVLGGRLDEGEMKLKQAVRILRRDIEIGTGIIRNLQQMKSDVEKITDGEFGMQLETRAEIAPGDYIEPYDTVVT